MRQRDHAQREHVEAKSKVEQCLSEIQKMYEQMDQARNLISDTEQAGAGSQVALFSSSHEFLSGQKIKIERKRIEARELMTVAEEKLEVLVLASQEFESLKKLKEKKIQEFKILKNKKEKAALDDLVTMRFNRSGS